MVPIDASVGVPPDRVAQKGGPVLVTGCSRGIGKATCERLVRAGYLVYASARSLASVNELKLLGCRTIELDVTDEASMQHALEVIKDAEGGVEVLVNNAGYGLYGPVEQTSLDEARAEFETNVFGLVRLTQLALPAMRARGKGRIVNVSSVAGRVSFPGGAFYQASKFALEALSDAMRVELSPFGIAVVVIEPGPVRTDWAALAAASIPMLVDEEDDPYVVFKASVQAMLTRRDSLFGRFVEVQPDDVARVIEHAIATSRPSARYPVGLSSKALLAVRRLVPDRAYDTVMRRIFRLP